MIGDGPNASKIEIPSARIYRLKKHFNDFGESPRRFGVRCALKEGFNVIAFLDADNWYFPHHLASLLEAHKQSGAKVCTARRVFVDLNGAAFALCDLSDGRTFCDTNCIAFFGPATQWALYSRYVGKKLRPIHDRILWTAIRNAEEQVAHTGNYSVAYRCKYHSPYLKLGHPLPQGLPRRGTAIGDALARWEGLGNASLGLPHLLRPISAAERIEMESGREGIPT
jgi:hypothetical protein